MILQIIIEQWMRTSDLAVPYNIPLVFALNSNLVLLAMQVGDIGYQFEK